MRHLLIIQDSSEFSEWGIKSILGVQHIDCDYIILMKIKFTIYLSSFEFTEEKQFKEKKKCYKELVQEVKKLIKDIMNISLTNSKWEQIKLFQLTNQTNQQEFQLHDDDQIIGDNKIVARFENDFEIMTNGIKALSRKYEQASQQITKDLRSLSSDRDRDIFIMVSNPLVRVKGESTIRIDRTYFSINDLTTHFLNIQQIPACIHITVATKGSILECKRSKAKIIIIFCDSTSNQTNELPELDKQDNKNDPNTNKTREFLFEEDSLIGVENKIPISVFIDELQKPALMIVIGNNAFLAIQQLEKKQNCKIDCLAINSTVFAQDELARIFLAEFLKKIILYQSQKSPSSDNTNQQKSDTTSAPKNPFDICKNRQRLLTSYFQYFPSHQVYQFKCKFNQLCCCYHDHDHKPGCKWLKIVQGIGKQAAHIELHQLHGYCLIDQCLSESGCEGKMVMQQLHPQLSSTDSKRLCTNICCCYYKDKNWDVAHSLDSKFKYIRKTDSIDYLKLKSEFSIKFSAQVRHTDEDFVLCRNDFIFKITQALRKEGTFIINLTFRQKSLKIKNDLLIKLVKCSVIYLMQRSYKIKYVQVNMQDAQTEQEVRNKLKEGLDCTHIQQIFTKLEGQLLVLCFYNIEKINKDCLRFAKKLIKDLSEMQQNHQGKRSDLKIVLEAALNSSVMDDQIQRINSKEELRKYSYLLHGRTQQDFEVRVNKLMEIGTDQDRLKNFINKGDKYIFYMCQHFQVQALGKRLTTFRSSVEYKLRLTEVFRRVEALEQHLFEKKYIDPVRKLHLRGNILRKKD